MSRPARHVVVIGGGPGGYTAAIRAAQVGLEVTVVERDALGGVCLNRGCIPTKAMVRCAAALVHARKGEDFGIEIAGGPEAVRPNLGAMVDRSNRIIEQLRRGIEQLFKHHRIRLVKGRGALLGPGAVLVEGGEGTEEIRADRVILATGTEPAPLKGVAFDGVRVVDSTDILQLREVPANLVISGAGIISVEFASIFARLGSKVTVLARRQVLRKEDPRVARHLERSLSKEGVRFLTGVDIEEHRPRGDGLSLRLNSGEEIPCDKLLVTVGRTANVHGIGLEEAGVDLSDGYVAVNERMETSAPGVYAIGDVVGGYLLAHVASAEGMVAATNCAGQEATIDYTVVPNCIFTAPESATVGLSEEEARERGYEVKTGRFSFAASGKALGDGEPDGFVQIVADAASGRVLGAQMVGSHVSDLIHEVALAIKLGAKAHDIGGMIHQHPTLSEIVMEAAESVDGMAIHVATRERVAR